ncbi:MAG: alpha-amylase [Chloroflexi bacterium RBG_19FT_COMBO_49_13]|nr:MAG: alpha-amylase [Chloroflexi bacterium RBG_16_47_49]OGO62229.1 MAG: alpha-amylase [Chloroflexi bacterium RBG_19FT_COMBO_49_13]
MPSILSPTYEFHISRQARDRYKFDEVIFGLTGNVIFANFHASRVFATRMNQKRDVINFPERMVRAGQINAMGLIDEILHIVVQLYRQQINPIVMQEALDWLDGMLGKVAVDDTLLKFVQEFPPIAVYRRAIGAQDYLDSESDGVSNRQIALEELLFLWLANANPAFSPFQELFDDSLLVKETAYVKLIPLIHAFFETQPPFGPENQNLVDMLRSPAIKAPHSLTAQLEFIRQAWGSLVGRYLYRLLGSLDLIQEEEKATFLGPGPARVYDFTGMELEPERYSLDKDWMPSLVLIAKNAYVWLDQLSKLYQRPIQSLDQIPDEELDRLSAWGFTGLWLIGLWERSSASKRIKQLRGNPEAVASAYSLFDYQIAGDLGGEDSFHSLRQRAWRRGLRLASDMVPNHMGIDSRWVIEHPDWFISQDYSPFPSYTFNGANLSWDERVGIYVEDHYFNNTDAAVVFKRVDYWSGQEKYIYHGNDGTSMPWNDTAQLNYLKPEVREAVIQTILHVARKFPVIRFDAAMTLAKKHYQRLWFPDPGTGGAIPSRAEHGLTREQFDAAIPVEFWREVVDRVAKEVPDTLLLAEAFWLMEGYFVRTLGMHRVYNSAFMHMLRDEKNAEYRLVMKNTLEFDPEILKRYVNFMNNPDERTAVDQFGKDDKYFGVCTLLVTLPGLPMFGHGQVEGFTEKYGMEYRRAYWDEKPDENLIERHKRQIFPLLKKRYLFSQVQDFLLYDFYTPEGRVNEDVYAYSNKSGSERGLVVYHNKFANAKGWIRTSAAYSVKTDGSEHMLIQKRLGEGLGLANDGNTYCIFRDPINSLEYIRNNNELHEKGLYIELEAYKCQVFMSFREVQDNEWHQYANLTAYLNGRGVPDIDDAMKELFLQPIHQACMELINPGSFRWIISNRLSTQSVLENPAALSETVIALLNEAETKSIHLLEEVKRITLGSEDVAATTESIKQVLLASLYLQAFPERFPFPRSRKYQQAMKYLHAGNQKTSPWKNGDVYTWGVILGWLVTSSLGRMFSATGYEEISRSWIDEWMLNKILFSTLENIGLDDRSNWRAVTMIKLLTSHHAWWKVDGTSQVKADKKAAYQILTGILADSDVQVYLGVNRYQDILWFNKESFEDLLWWLFIIATVEISSQHLQFDQSGEVGIKILQCYDKITTLIEHAEASGYKLEKLLELVE